MITDFAVLEQMALSRNIEQVAPPDKLNLHRNGREWAGACPFCGTGEDRFFLRPQQNWWGCRACQPKYATTIQFVMRDHRCTYSEAVKLLTHNMTYTPLVQAGVTRKDKDGWIPPEWSRNGAKYLRSFMSHPDRIKLWQEYRPISEELIELYQLGVGKLPLSRCHHERLIVPVMEDGVIVALRGRRIDCDCDAWLNSKGIKKSLFGLDRLPQGAIVVIEENNANSLLTMSHYGKGWHGLAPVTGAGTNWEKWWIERLVASKPKQVVIAFDNDVAGNPNRKVLEKFKTEHPSEQTPLNGQKLQRQLAQYGIVARLWEWMDETPEKAGLDWYYMDYLKGVTHGTL